MNPLARYLVFNKPYGVISQFSDASGERPTLRDYVHVPGVYPVGRLDHDSEGLVLLTGDGWLQHRLTDPRYEHPKTYWVQVEGVPTEDALLQLRTGIQLWPDFRSRPAQVMYHGLPRDPERHYQPRQGRQPALAMPCADGHGHPCSDEQ